MEPKTHKTTIETELSRDLGLTSTLAIGIGTMIAAGIFTLSGLAIRNVGSAAILSFLLASFYSKKKFQIQNTLLIENIILQELERRRKDASIF